ncbi:unnamed protein product [Closterium sp. NIES-64]|nr:unnamed protein product [Closterium sp. NIES-64]CAI6003875.1 unnamed protein product [Closterium sp. NIES-65]
MAPAPQVFKQWMQFKPPMVLLQCAIAEIVGTMYFVFQGVLCSAIVTPGAKIEPLTTVVIIALGNGVAYALAVAGTLGISGGHINPATTIAMLSVGLIDVLSAVVYIIGQLVGSLVGVGLATAVLPSALNRVLGAPSLPAGTSSGTGFLAVLLFTSLLIFTVFATAVDPRGPIALAPLMIGLTILTTTAVGVPLSGGTINPAQAFGTAVWQGLWTNQWIYWLAPVLAGIAVAVPYAVVYLLPLSNKGDDDDEKV